MAADQAAGLRRRRAARAAHCVQLVSASPAVAHRLVDTLGRQGYSALLVDVQGRQFVDAARSLFDWRQQLARRQPHLLPLDGGEGWYAPGLAANADLSVLTARYDCLVFDCDPAAPASGLPPAPQTLLLEVRSASLQSAYAWLKTCAHHRWDAEMALFGEAAAGLHLQAACRQFLGEAFAQKLGNPQCEADAFAALAVRMAVEETGPRAVA
ncbi:MAG: hypothetical protein ACLGH6_02565 [Gammaproteobacteria bacterium]